MKIWVHTVIRGQWCDDYYIYYGDGTQGAFKEIRSPTLATRYESLDGRLSHKKMLALSVCGTISID